MNKLFLLIFTVTFLSGQDIFESFNLDGKHRYVGKTTYEFDVRDAQAADRTVEIFHVTGDVEVEGKPTTIVTVVERMTIRTTSERKAQSIYEDYKAQVSKSGHGHITVDGGGRHEPYKTWFKYYITVPTEYNVSVKTSGGDVSLNYVSGEIYLNTSGGDLTIKSVNGKVTGRTSGGDIILKSINGLANVKTSGGDIEISDCDGKLEATTSGGDIEAEYCKGELFVHTSGGNIKLRGIQGPIIHGRTSGGDIEVEEIEGSLNVATSGGDIEIQDVNGNVEAETSGGDIEIYNIDGSADVSTSAGDIEGSLLYGAVYAKTSHGDININKSFNPFLADHNIKLKTSDGTIRLVLPKDFSATVDAIVEGRRSTGAIDSEFPLNIFLHRDEVHAEGTINEGTHTIKLRTRYRSITIEKD